MIMMQNFIEQTCGDKDSKQGGWALSGSGYLIVDSDPDLHNPGQAAETIQCTNGAADKMMSLNASMPVQRRDVECPPGTARIVI